MDSRTENLDLQYLQNNEEYLEAAGAKHIQIAIKWRIGSAIGLTYQFIFTILFGYAIYHNNTCTNVDMMDFGQDIVWLSFFIVSCLCVIFASAILLNHGIIYHWRKYFYIATIIVGGWDLFLLVGSFVVYAKGNSENGCEFLYSLYKYFIIITCIMLAIVSVIIFHFVQDLVESYFWRNKNDKLNY